MQDSQIAEIILQGTKFIPSIGGEVWNPFVGPSVEIFMGWLRKQTF